MLLLNIKLKPKQPFNHAFNNQKYINHQKKIHSTATVEWRRSKKTNHLCETTQKSILTFIIKHAFTENLTKRKWARKSPKKILSRFSPQRIFFKFHFHSRVRRATLWKYFWPKSQCKKSKKETKAKLVDNFSQASSQN